MSTSILASIVWAPLRLAKWIGRWLSDAERYWTFPFAGFRGVCGSFEEALALAPRSLRVGYDHRDLAEEYAAALDLRLQGTDYPILYHLGRILGTGSTVVDFGGNVGSHFLRYRRHLPLEGVAWIVCDLPEIIRVGRAVCAEHRNVSFTTTLSEVGAAKVDVLLASGSLQYVEPSSPAFPLQALVRSGRAPAHFLVARLPLYDGPTFTTLQNGGLVCYPQYVFNRAQFVGAVTGLGYRLVDAWDDPNDTCIIPFHRDRAIRAYSGLRFERA